MPEIKLKARIQNKYETLQDWNKINKEEFIPLKGEVCYGVDNGLLYQKIGDGITDFVDLPWILNQSDNDEADVNSPAYIKNRIAYIDYQSIPVDEQLLQQDYFVGLDVMDNNTPIIPTNAIPNMKNYFPNSKNIMISFPQEEALHFPALEDAKIEDSIYELQISNDKATYIYSWNWKEFIKNTQPLGMMDVEIYCMGNTNWGNVFLNFMTEQEAVDTLEFFPPNINKEEKYSIIILKSSNAQTSIECSAYLLTDTDFFPPKQQDKLLTYDYKLNILSKGKVHTIDSRYLGDIQADQNCLDPSKNSYIKNRFGTYDTISSNGYQILGGYAADLTTELKGEGIREITDEQVIELPMAESLQIAQKCDVHINEVVYSDCPIFQFVNTLTNTSAHDYIIGNPKLFGDYIKASFDEDLNDYGIYAHFMGEYEDNGLPFVFGLNDDSLKPLGSSITPIFLDAPQNFQLMVGLSDQSATFKPIPKYLIPEPIVVGEYLRHHNSILFNSAYAAEGSNSAAFNQGTEALGDNSVAFGQNSVAKGENSISAGDQTLSSGENSLSLGNNTITSGRNSITSGVNNLNKAENSLVLGSMTEAVGQNNICVGQEIIDYESCTRPSASEARFQASNTIQYNKVFDEENQEWVDCSVSYEDGIGIAEFYGGPIDINLTNLKFSYISKIENRGMYVPENTILVGTASKAKSSNSAIFGEGLKNTYDSQTVIGKYNLDVKGPLVVGNGQTFSDRSNALDIDWEGNVNIGGSLVFNHSNINTNSKYMKLEDILTDQIKAKIKYKDGFATSPYENNYITVLNKNLWSNSGWGEPDAEGVITLTYEKGSILKFYPDGSIYLNHKAGDYINQEITTKYPWPIGKYHLSNGLGYDPGFVCYISSRSSGFSTSSTGHTGYPYSITNFTTHKIGLVTDNKEEDYEVTLYPQLELDEITKFTPHKEKSFFFDHNGETIINLLQFNDWENAQLVCCADLDPNINVYYEGVGKNQLSIYPELNHSIKKDKRYIFDLTQLKEKDKFEFDAEDGILDLSIYLGEYDKINCIWNSYYSSIAPSQLEVVDLYSDAFANSLESQALGGYRLNPGYLLNNIDNWSTNTEEFRLLLTNVLHNTFINGNVRLIKTEEEEKIYCKLSYNLELYGDITETISEIMETLLTANKFICYLPEGCNNIFVK